jgi:hypothetical protein
MWEAQQKEKKELKNVMTRVKFSSEGIIGKTIRSNLHDKINEILENRDYEIDKDHDIDTPQMSRNISIKLYTGTWTFSIEKIYRKKNSISSGNEKWFDDYSHQGISDYRAERPDLYLMLTMVEEPYFLLLPAAMFKVARDGK